jgi:adenylate cyclase
VAQQSVERRLAAILAADVAGYSRLMGVDEVGTLRALKAHRKELFDPVLSAHHGRIVKTTGDGVLVEFPSAVDAVASAVAIQRGMIARNADIPQDRRIELRIGINVGDVVIDGDDIQGDGVNVAARLEALAEQGGLCISGTAYDQVRDKLPFAFTDRGEQTVKNISRPVRVYALGADAVAALGGIPASIETAQTRRPLASRRIWQAAVGIPMALLLVAGGWFVMQPARSPPLSPSAAPRLSIVVLPFANLSGDPSQDYLADVITEELTTGLSRIGGTFVIARSTAFTYKGKPVDVKQIGRDLGVRYVLEGSEQHGGNRVRVNAQLIDAETGAHLWADQFDADRSDPLQMQDEIVTRLANALELPLYAVDAARVARTHPGNPDAQDLAVRCVAPIVQGSAVGADFSLCEQALQIDDRNSWALAYLPFKYIFPVLNAQSADPQADIKRADDIVSRALAVDPNSYVAHEAKSWVLMTQKRPDEAIVEAQRALTLNPSFIDAYRALCVALYFGGHPEKTIECTDKALRLSPRDPQRFPFYFYRGYAHFMLHQDDQAIEWSRRAVALGPSYPLTHAVLAASLAEIGHEAEARETLKHYLSLSTTKARTIADWKAFMQGVSDNSVWLAAAERLYDGLRKAGMPEE